MRNNLKIKGNISKITAIFALLLFIVCYACMEELRHSLEGDDNSLAIERAKNWYEANKPEETFLRSLDETIRVAIEPEWTHAFYMTNDEYEVVETELMMQKRFSYIDKDCMNKYEETVDHKYMQSYSRIVFRRDLKTNETVGFLMTFIPNLEWLEKSNFKPFLHSSYLEPDKDYGGMILFHELDGGFSTGWRYERGKITGELSSTTAKYSGVTFRNDDCETYYVWRIYYECSGWGIMTENYYGDCYVVDMELIGIYNVCPGSGDGGYGGGSPGGSPTVTLTAPTHVDLMQPYGLSVSVANINCSSVVFKINDQYTLQSGTSTTCNEKAKKAGTWTIKAIVNGTYESAPKTVEVRYPDINAISSNSTVSGAMSSAWAATKDAASLGRSERGFYIYANTTSMSYECGSTIPGTVVSCDETATIEITGSETISESPTVGGKYAVAIFHTHTPLTYCPSNKFRVVGPSGTDNLNSSYPELLYDYAAIYYLDIDRSGIRGGHDINAGAQIYTYGVSRRATP